MPFGYHGRILKVDLTTGSIDEESREDPFYRTYVGGKAMAAYYLLKEVPTGADPLSPENVLAFMVSPITGVPIAGYSRYLVASKSPMTGGYGEAESGGFWASELKFAGFDGIVIKGRSERPVYLLVRDGKAEIRDASHLWGKTTADTEAAIREELGDQRVRVASIGPAGERMVRYACIMHESRNAAGRCGHGAVMGSKNLKAVAVRGTGKVPVKDEEGVRSIARWFRESFMDNPQARALYDLGTDAVLPGMQAGKMLPTRNFSLGQFEEWEKLAPETIEKKVGRGKWGCYACQVRCKRTARAPSSLLSPDWEFGVKGNGKEPLIPSPEYETIAAFGSNLGISDVDAILAANWICNQAGVDTISAGVTIGFAMECFEKGFIGPEDTGGLDLRFGSVNAALEALRLLVRREGFGDLLAQGTKRMAEAVGKGSEEFAVQCKGVEIAMHDPRGKVGVGLGYAVASHGGDHMVAAHDTMFLKPGSHPFNEIAPFGLYCPVDAYDLGPSKVRHFHYLETWWDALKTYSVCFFCIAPRSLMPVNTFVDSVRAVTGWNVSLFEIMKAGERAGNLARVFSLREGVGGSEDALPPRLLGPTVDLEKGQPGIPKESLARAISEYYTMRGWNPETGVPQRAKLEELGVGWAADYLHRLKP